MRTVRVTLELSGEAFDKLCYLVDLLRVNNSSELVEYLIEDQMYQLEGSTVAAEALNIGEALSEVLDPDISIGEVKLHKVEVDQLPMFKDSAFDELLKKSPEDQILLDSRDSETARRACELVYARLDRSQWGSDAARQLVDRTIKLIDKGEKSGHNKPVG